MSHSATKNMPLSVFDIFQIGVGPSSSHTVGPMNAGYHFASTVDIEKVQRIQVELQGSLAATGRGHATDRAVLAGLEGHKPSSIPASVMPEILERIKQKGYLQLRSSCDGKEDALEIKSTKNARSIPFDINKDLLFNPSERPEFHVNSLVIRTWDDKGEPLRACRYYSTGGGFVTVDSKTEGERGNLQLLGDINKNCSPSKSVESVESVRKEKVHEYSNFTELLSIAKHQGLRLSQIVLDNEKIRRSEIEINKQLDDLTSAMISSIERGIATEGVLPGGLHVLRRAPALAAKLCERMSTNEQNNAVGTPSDPLRAMDWVNMWALAVNEENAAGGRIVRAPTNGAAGVVPAVLRYLLQFSIQDSGERASKCARRFLLVAGAVGAIIKRNASIAGAEVGCQGEIGSACAMAAAGLAEAWNATPAQVENAAEIAMEHCLGLTCDPIGGLVQIPCIERNAIAAIQAINAARLALWGDGTHRVTFDEVIETMRQTGADMNSKYKETAAGGLAVNVVEC